MAELLERDSELTAVGELIQGGGVLLVEGGAGIGKTSILDAACALARGQEHVVLRASGSELERDFAFGAVRQVFERYCSDDSGRRQAVLFSGPAAAARPLLQRGAPGLLSRDNGFAVLHGLYWLAANLAAQAPLLLAIDDVHWVDEASLRWLAYLVPRLDGLKVSLIVALRPGDPGSDRPSLVAIRTASNARTICPPLLSPKAVGSMVRGRLGANADAAACESIQRATGGNPFYIGELLRALERAAPRIGAHDIEELVSLGGVDGVTLRLQARLRRLDPAAMKLAQSLAILGDDCELRHAAALANLATGQAIDLATELVRFEVLCTDRPLRFIHPIVRHAVAQTLSAAEQDGGHRAAARVLHGEGAQPGQVAAHLIRLRATGDAWIVERLRAAGRAAIADGSPAVAVELFERALAEPPAAAIRVDVLREAAAAHQLAGRESACRRLEEALAISTDRLVRADLMAELARAHIDLFRWRDAVDVLEDALAEVADAKSALAVRLESQLVEVGLQDARTASRALRVMGRWSRCEASGPMSISLSLARGIVAILTGEPADQATASLESALSGIEAGMSWDSRAALLWCLIAAEQFGTAASTLARLHERTDRSSGSRALVAFHSTLALLKQRLGDLAEAESAARVALCVALDGDFARGLPFAATVLAEISIAGGQIDEAQGLLDTLPQGDLPAGVGTVLIPAARGRLLLAQGRAREALAQFESCIRLWDPAIWGLPMRDAGYTHSRSWAAMAKLALGDERGARELAGAELADARRFGGARALGIALRAAGLAEGGTTGLAMLEESAGVLRDSLAALEKAASLIEWGAALRRAGHRSDARAVLAEGLDGAARCGAPPLVARAREELRVAGARPRRDWLVGKGALTPGELRVLRLARAGRTNRQIAQELYVAIKTVEGHLGRAYGKLGIATREELHRLPDL